MATQAKINVTDVVESSKVEPLHVMIALLCGGCLIVDGRGILGGQKLLNTFAGSYYPTYLRSTGMGWCLGIGRFGAIIGPLFAGELIRRNVPQSQLFMVAGSLALTATVVILIIGVLMRPTKTEPAPRKEVLAH